MRAEESTTRARAQRWRERPDLYRGGRTWYEWRPVHDRSEAEVFDAIRTANQVPHHAYANGMRRVSCIFCIFSTPEDLCTAKRLAAELCREYRTIEVETGHTLSPTGRNLDELTTGVPRPGAPTTGERP